MELVALLGVVLALIFAILWRRAVARARAREQLWRTALRALATRDYDGVETCARMMEGSRSRAFSHDTKESVTPLAGDPLAGALRETSEELVAREREQEVTRRELEDVLSSLQDAVLVVDGETRLRFLNAAALRLFEVRVEDVLGAQLLEALPSFGLDSAVRAALHQGHSTMSDVNLYPLPGQQGTPGSSRRDVFLRVAPVHRSDGTVSGAVAILQDLTQMRRLERVRREFVANASHELRTPIANIRAAAETVLSDPQDVALATRFLPHLVNEAERLSHLVSDLLDLARAESPADAPSTSVDLHEVATDVIRRLQDKAARNNITLHYKRENGARARGDAAGLEQVVFNLLDNALIYTPPGGSVTVQIGARQIRSGEIGPDSLSHDSHRAGNAGSDGQSEVNEVDNDLERASSAATDVPAVPDRTPIATRTVTLRVSDTGSGIPADDLPRIFERFYRVDKARSRAQGGTGLGLAIVKHIVENHGGHVRVESEVGRGTTFTVTLPAA